MSALDEGLVERRLSFYLLINQDILPEHHETILKRLTKSINRIQDTMKNSFSEDDKDTVIKVVININSEDKTAEEIALKLQPEFHEMKIVKFEPEFKKYNKKSGEVYIRRNKKALVRSNHVFIVTTSDERMSISQKSTLNLIEQIKRTVMKFNVE